MGIVTNKGIGGAGITPVEIHVFVDELIPIDFIEIEGAGHLNVAFGPQFIDQVLVRGFFVDLIQRVKYRNRELSL
jgi:hypothetical protein